MDPLKEIKELLPLCSPEQRKQIFMKLRVEFPIHPLETDWNVSAELILEAIHRASDLTQRGVRGVIAESAFQQYVVEPLKAWEELPVKGNQPFDFLLKDRSGKVRVQVKMQRLKDHKPMLANQGYKALPGDRYVVETQRTRGGKDPKTGKSTRPYRFGEFDLLAVSLYPSTGNWSDFLYTVANWLLQDNKDKQCLLKSQPVPFQPDDNWTGDFQTCVAWLRSKKHKKIS